MLSACGKAKMDPQLRPYYDKFYEEASLRGLTPDEPTSVELVDTTQECESQDLSGCSYTRLMEKKIYLDAKTWEQSSEEEREFILFHELGHAVLDKGHTEVVHEFLAKPLASSCFLTDHIKLPSLMYPSLTGLPAGYANYRAAILDEFFLGKSFPKYQTVTEAELLTLATDTSLQLNCCKDFPELGFCKKA
jgi:hypothetical protein